MHLFFTLVFISIVGHTATNNVDNSICIRSSSNWCQSYQTAKACGVLDQCKNYVWNYDNDRINFSLYYETLCPDCRQFIQTRKIKIQNFDDSIRYDKLCFIEVWNSYQAVLSIVNITFIPYGNAKELFRPETGLWQFYCQHGSSECLGNVIHACTIYFYPDIQQHLPFIYCTESTEGDVQEVAEECAKKSSVDIDKINACTHSKLGNGLEHTYALMTEALTPQHTFVPWVTINGEHTAEIQQAAETDLIGLICKTYKGSNIPDECKKR
ncbi:unnamed protein product [Didymodactylos carnosus]|nr:unnamed protein product [Didymodactylos carnosus]CAF3584712.1 unnamed protein product [Didymodactylos carnosus]